MAHSVVVGLVYGWIGMSARGFDYDDNFADDESEREVGKGGAQFDPVNYMADIPDFALLLWEILGKSLSN